MKSFKQIRFELLTSICYPKVAFLKNEDGDYFFKDVQKPWLEFKG